MYLIGLTGNIAVGKSTVRRMLEQLGARAIDADALAHAVLLKGSVTWRAVVDAFGYNVLHADGDIDRQKLGSVVFADVDKLRHLESIVHPAVSTELALMLRDAREPVVVVEAIKLVEAGLHHYCDALWLVTAPPAEQKRRLVHERGTNELDAQLRMRAQPPLDEKLQLAHVLIDNGGTLEATRVQVARAYALIRADAASDKAPLLASLLQLTPTRENADAPVSVEEAVAPTAVAAPPPDEQTKMAAVVDEETREELIARARDFEISIRRARPGDVDTLAKLLAQMEGSDTPLSRAQVLKRLGKWGYWLAEGAGEGLALAAWQAENLLAVVRELWSHSPQLASRVFPPLLGAIEQEAMSLHCEALAIITTPAQAALVHDAAAPLGYAPTSLEQLHPNWRPIAEASLLSGEVLYLKRLREQLVTRPI